MYCTVGRHNEVHNFRIILKPCIQPHLGIALHYTTLVRLDCLEAHNNILESYACHRWKPFEGLQVRMFDASYTTWGGQKMDGPQKFKHASLQMQQASQSQHTTHMLYTKWLVSNTLGPCKAGMINCKCLEVPRWAAPCCSIHVVWMAGKTCG